MNRAHSKHIVVVDDEPDYVRLIADTLRRAGFRVTVFTDAREANELVIRDADGVDLVVTDVMMNHLSEGFDLARLLRTHPKTRKIPTVILTGVRETYDVASEVGADWYPCDAFLEKPVEAHDLVRIVCSILEVEAPHELQGDRSKGGTEVVMTEDALVRALVVEDDPDYAALLAGMLQDAGYSVRTALDGECALKEVRAQRPDVITLDIQMPRKSGLLFYRQLKSNPEFRAIPVVVVTGITRDDRDTEVFVHTFLEVEHLPSPAAYIEKPVGADELLGTVRASLQAETR
jgi:CheY-like chemotaxis protein